MDYVNQDTRSIKRNNKADDDKNGFIVVDDQNPAKARILMALSLTKTTDLKQLQDIFLKY
ncbi:hypothetical protein [Pseudomonas sp. URMO17WK12:I12]|jgi:L-asparaginase/Glu-tRNA(Gln) amidotransferase subunit D|uniref:hypothetical protein n=1 Tax=Pseudomonas sp. URMO17WK12:I12 TaxID=1259797 RepID=UPI000489816B|nr:hypothetical protein [Pseudomonas sp. URMO17WK12:I12]